MKLLVSVRSVEEARAALAGGADLIDVKEPTRGSLGRADEAVVEAIIKTIDNRVPVSAAGGELKDAIPYRTRTLPLHFLKLGLSQCAGIPWMRTIDEIRHTCSSVVVPTAYADCRRADSPPVDQVLRFAVNGNCPVLLIDTFTKDGACLFDWLTESKLAETIKTANNHQIKIALAGALRVEHLPILKRLRPEWIAIRGAACHSESRAGAVDQIRVRSFKDQMIF